MFGTGFETVNPRIEYYLKGLSLQNFGDYLSPLLAKHLLHGPRLDADIYHLVGSVIDAAWITTGLRSVVGLEKGLIAYWGCGLRQPAPLPAKIQALCAFCGVRGSLTRDLLGLPTDTPLGDPGLLLPIVVQPTGNAISVGKTLCIPHIFEPADRELLHSMSGCDLMISPLVENNESSLIAIIDAIANAEFVLTGSLHGAIVACAFGRPFAYWDTGFIDTRFKWDDFSSSIGIESMFAHNLSEGRAIYEDGIRNSIRRPSLSNILQVAPFTPKPSAVMRALAYDGIADPADSVMRALTKFDLLTDNVVRRYASESQRSSSSWFNPIIRAAKEVGLLRKNAKHWLRRIVRRALQGNGLVRRFNSSS
jgi:hypothetical protein